MMNGIGGAKPGSGSSIVDVAAAVVTSSARSGQVTADLQSRQMKTTSSAIVFRVISIQMELKASV